MAASIRDRLSQVVLENEGLAMSPIEEMARNCYGYGRWDAPYWFIGLEQGMDGSLDKYVEAFRDRGREGLSDCQAFHEHMGVAKWHRKKPKAALQSTWKKLIRLLPAFLEQDAEATNKKEVDEETEKVRAYQVHKWGMDDGDTCVIELSGLPAKGLKAGVTLKGEHFTREQVSEILQERIASIRQRIKDNNPQLVVMYGLDGRTHFSDLAGRPTEYPLVTDETIELGSAITTLTYHPVFPGPPNAHWTALGKKLLRESKKKGPTKC
jgi:hypothetical protein